MNVVFRMFDTTLKSQAGRRDSKLDGHLVAELLQAADEPAISG